MKTKAEPGLRLPSPRDRPRLQVGAVVFDMDGLLLDTERLAREALRVEAARLGIPLTDELHRLMIGSPADANRRLFMERLGPDVPIDELQTSAALRLKADIDAGQLPVKPGAAALLSTLQRAGLPSAVATSSGRLKAEHHLRACGLLDRFDAIVTRDDVARGKPHPDLYLQAVRALGVAAHRCLALEDSYNGVRSAYAAGLPVVMVPDLLPATPEMRQRCWAVVEGLDQVPALIALDRRHAAA